VPGGTRRNLAAVEPHNDLGAVPESMRLILADAQTSGGLLLAVDAPLGAALLEALSEEGVEGRVVGRVVARSFADGPRGRITVG